MSGGSYDYLCYKDASDLLGNQYVVEENLDRMVNRLAELGYVDAAQESMAVLAEARRATARIGALIERMRDVWHAVEWLDDGDFGPHQLEEAMRRYRGEEQPVADAQVS